MELPGLVFGSLRHVNRTLLLTIFQQIRSIISKKAGPFEQVKAMGQSQATDSFRQFPSIYESK